MQQNFLVIAGDDTCPIAPAVQLAGSTPVFVDAGTVQHQP